MSSLITLAREDFKHIVESEEWKVELIFYSSVMENGISVYGITTDHTNIYDPDDGTKTLDRSLHVNVVEESLIDAGIITRDSNNDVDLNNWKIQVMEETGAVNTVVREVHPDKKIGCIRMILDLADYE